MSESPKAKLRFSYLLGDDDCFRGGADFFDAKGARTSRGQLERPLSRREWLGFVLERIREDREAEVYDVSVRQASGASRVHVLDERTVAKIKKGELTLDDMLL